MYGWEKFNETSFPEKEGFLHLSKYASYYWCRLHACKKVYKDFEIKKLGEYHDLYIQGNTLFLAHVFENFWNMCLEIYEPDPALVFVLR